MRELVELLQYAGTIVSRIRSSPPTRPPEISAVMSVVTSAPSVRIAAKPSGGMADAVHVVDVAADHEAPARCQSPRSLRRRRLE
jgi:hypothetical protein